MARPRTHRIWTIDVVRFAAIVAASPSLAQVLRNCGCSDAPGEYKAVRARIAEERLDTGHFRPYGNYQLSRYEACSLEDVLVEHSSYNRGHLKKRLIEARLLEQRCYIDGCPIATEWLGRPIVLVLDHINGVGDDNRIENLRLVCPNCNSQLDTFAGRKNGRGLLVEKRPHGLFGRSRLERRKAVRPPYERLCREIVEMGYCAVGRKYGVSDNAIRKWKRHYEMRASVTGEHN